MGMDMFHMYTATTLRVLYMQYRHFDLQLWDTLILKRTQTFIFNTLVVTGIR